jgi:hypothetical protein
MLFKPPRLHALVLTDYEYEVVPRVQLEFFVLQSQMLLVVVGELVTGLGDLTGSGGVRHIE